MKLGTLLHAYIEPIHGGPGDSAPLPVKQLEEQLEALRRENNHYFAILAAMVLVIFLAALWVVIHHGCEAVMAGSTTAGAGVGTVAAVTLMSRIWREKVAVDLLLALTPRLEPELLKPIILVLSQRFRAR
ncbi:hypothetical protein WMF30_51630 [Sorangium sp. So ce134]